MNTTTMPLTPGAEAPVMYVGWIRKSGRAPWKLFCRAATEQQCLDVLMREAPRGCDKLIRLEAEGDPNRSRRGPR